jgi:hypothetical protein
MTARVVYLTTGAARCTFPYSAGLVSAIKNIVPAGYRRYDPDDHSWTVEPPYGPRVSLLIMEVYPDAEVEHRTTWRPSEPSVPAIDPDYRTLHLLPSAPPPLVEAAYKCLARLSHPDAGGSTEDMQQLNAARDAIRSRVGAA